MESKGHAMRHTSLLLASVAICAFAAPAFAQTALPQANDSYFMQAQELLAQLEATTPNTGKAKNVILFIGDGMSIPTLAASRIFEGQQQGVDGESHHMAWEDLLP